MTPIPGIRIDDIRPGQLHAVQPPEAPPVRRWTRQPPPRVTLEGVVVDVIEPESGAPIIVVAVGNDGAEIECRPSRERFYAEDLKHLRTGVGCEITGGDGGDWVMTRLLADADPNPITTYVETGQGLLTIADDSVSIAHTDGDDTGLFSSGAGVTRIAHSDDDSESALAIVPDGVSLWGVDAGLYTRQDGSPATAKGAAPPDGALIIGRVAEGGLTSVAAYAIPMLLDTIAANSVIPIATMPTLPATVPIRQPVTNLHIGNLVTNELFPNDAVGQLHLSMIFQDVSKWLLVSGNVGAAGPAQITRTAFDAPTGFRISLAPAGLDRQTAAIVHTAFWTAPANFGMARGDVYRIRREWFPGAGTGLTSPTSVILRDNILPSAAPPTIFDDNGLEPGAEYVVRGTSRIPTIMAAIGNLDGAYVASAYSGGSGATVYSNQQLDADDEVRIIVLLMQSGDALAMQNIVQIASNRQSATIAYASFLAAAGARLADRRGNTATLETATVGLEYTTAYTVQARRLGVNLVSPASDPVIIVAVGAAAGYHFAPA